MRWLLRNRLRAWSSCPSPSSAKARSHRLLAVCCSEPAFSAIAKRRFELRPSAAVVPLNHREQPEIVNRRLQAAVVAESLVNRLALLEERARLVVPPFLHRDDSEELKGVSDAFLVIRRGVQLPLLFHHLASCLEIALLDGDHRSRAATPRPRISAGASGSRSSASRMRSRPSRQVTPILPRTRGGPRRAAARVSARRARAQTGGTRESCRARSPGARAAPET